MEALTELTSWANLAQFVSSSSDPRTDPAGSGLEEMLIPVAAEVVDCLLCVYVCA